MNINQIAGQPFWLVALQGRYLESLSAAVAALKLQAGKRGAAVAFRPFQ